MTEKTNKKLRVSMKKKPVARLTSQESFYTKVMNIAAVMDFETAAGFEGLDDEITLLRVRIKSLLENDPENTRMIIAVTKMLAVLVKTRYSMTPEQKASLAESIKAIIKDIGVPLGVAAMNKKL